MDTDLGPLRQVPDPARRAQQASQLVSQYQVAVNELSRIRREAIEELIGAGRSQTDIAQLLGMTRARVGQLLSSGPKTERALLGTGPLTIAVGGKRELDSRGAGRVVAQEDLNAFNQLSELARTLGLDAATYEVIEPPGFVDLSRDNLVVICGPRLSPVLAQILDSDRHLRFVRHDHGWFLRDTVTETEFRSPMDQGQHRDYAYLGRLPRLDGRGFFLYIAGIHAVGAPGAVHYLANNLSELYTEVKAKRFSTLIECEFDPDTLAITSSWRVTPIYGPDSM